MPKKKTPTIVPGEKGHLFAVNRPARRMLASHARHGGSPNYTPVPMRPLRKFVVGFGSDDAETRYILNGDEFTPPRRERYAR